MKYITIFFILFAFSLASGQAIEVSSKITDVTVYQQYAKISRTATAQISTGTNEIVLESLSKYIQANSIQAQVGKGAILLSATFRTNYLKDAKKSKKIELLNDSLQLMKDDIDWINDQISIYKGETELIEKNQQLANEKTGFTVSELKNLADFYRSRLFEIRKKYIELDKQKKDYVERKNRINQQLRELNALQKVPCGEIVLSISTEKAKKISIDFSYLVYNAKWSPLYDIRTNGTDKPVSLVYKAYLRQNTGFDWENMKLSVSTGNPSVDNNRPLLHPWFIDFVEIKQYSNAKGYSKRKMEPMAQMQQLNVAQESIVDAMLEVEEEADEGFGGAGLFDPGFDVSVSSNQINTVYEILTEQAIPSDNKDHLVAIKTYSLDAKFTYHAVPKLNNGAFLLAKIADYGNYSLLPGNANLFSDGVYIGQSYLNPQTTADTLLISLGRDDKISIKRIQLKDLTSKKFIGSNVKETKAYEILIRNNKSTKINLEVLDQIPVSKQKDIQVELIDAGGAKVELKYGKLSWDIEIPASKSKRIKFIYSVKYPKGKTVELH